MKEMKQSLYVSLKYRLKNWGFFKAIFCSGMGNVITSCLEERERWELTGQKSKLKSIIWYNVIHQILYVKEILRVKSDILYSYPIDGREMIEKIIFLDDAVTTMISWI